MYGGGQCIVVVSDNATPDEYEIVGSNNFIIKHTMYEYCDDKGGER